MTKRDFELIARTFHAQRIRFMMMPEKQAAIDELAEVFAHELENTNPRFDRERFLKACGVA